ncbi:MAG: glycoside hydrolase family 2 TIM barrel-domain containing protein [Cyclobacteriaceae bacterium]
MKLPLTSIVILFLFTIPLHAQTTVAQADGQWQILVDGKPFKVKGVTIGFDQDTANYDTHFEDLKFLGVNALRIWNHNKYTTKLLDAAHNHGMKAMVGIWMRHGRPGMEADDSFDYLTDTAGMHVMYKDAINAVEKYKNHPAVLSWGVGNEVYLNMATDAEKLAYSLFLESVCQTIKSIDPNHPITSVEAWTFGMDWWQKHVPSIDIYGLNCYGPGADLLQKEMEKRNIDKPYIITEFGVSGEWDMPEDENGIKIEPNDTQKYNAIVAGYKNWIDNKSSCLGVFNFHYADDNQFISTWLLTHHRGKYRPQYWAIREAYTGEKPKNFVPAIATFETTGGKVGDWVAVDLTVTDPEGEALMVDFFYNQRTGSRKRRDQLNKLDLRGNLSDGFEIKLPAEKGAIKIYANVTDSYQNIGIATTSVKVIDEKNVANPYQTAKVKLPFYIYQDGQNEPYIASAQMGNYQALEIDIENTKEVKNGSAALKIHYNDTKNWFGLALVDPPNDWGNRPGGYDISGAKKYSFWAKADDKIKVTVGFGLIDKDQPFPDSAKEAIEIELDTEWKKYSINVKKLDLRCIRSGFVIFGSADDFRQTIYIDDIVFE